MVERIFSLLHERGIKLKSLTNAVGLTEAAVSSWKHGNHTPNADALVKTVAFFDVSLDFLMTGKEFHRNVVVASTVNHGTAIGQINGTVSAGLHNSKEAADLLRIYEMLDVKKRAALMHCAWELEGN